MLRPSCSVTSSIVLTNSKRFLGGLNLLSIRCTAELEREAFLPLILLSIVIKGSSTWVKEDSFFLPLEIRLQKSAYFSPLSLSRSRYVKIYKITSFVNVGPASFKSTTPLKKSLKEMRPVCLISKALNASDALS